MPVRLYNTLTQKIEDLVTITPGKVSLYVCGITTYDLAHAGHARTYTTFDVLVRFLKATGYEVSHCRNVTDVDDRIVQRAKEKGQDPLAFSRHFSDIADRQLETLGCARPDSNPRVSTTIPEIIAIIEKLIAKEAAYVTESTSGEGKDVYYNVRSFPPYGKLSRRNLDDLRAGASERLSDGANDVKKDPLDFALWKASPKDGFGFESPWGKGRPGWHIECSAMVTRELGEHIDIHGGGMDLVFPHHENEIAQSEAISGPELARFWMHAGFLEIDNEKMAKSLGNFVTIKDVLDRNDPEGYRYFVLGTHYRGPLNFDVEVRCKKCNAVIPLKNEAGENVTACPADGTPREAGRVLFPGLDEAEKRMDYLYGTKDALTNAAEGAEPKDSNILQGQTKIVESAPERVLEALARDLNTPVALSVLAELGKAANEIVMQVPKLRKDPATHEAVKGLAAKARRSLEKACAPLGLMQASSEEYWRRTRARRLALRGLEEAAIDAKVNARAEARKAKDFARADALRKELGALGVEVFDAGDASTWKIGI
jgi:cysteinyl-tRNA synthetase